MNKIEQLIKKYCPEGVVRKKLGNICEPIKTGKSNRQDESDNGAYPLYVRSANVLKADTYQYDDKEAILIPGEGGIGDIFHYVKGKYALHQRVYRIKPFQENNVKFIYYYLTSGFKEYILGKALNAAVSSIRKPMLESFEIPLPPLEVQQEIVSILDTFVDMIDNLNEELELKQKQFTHYCEELIGNADGEEKSLGEIGKMERGTGLMKSDFTEEGYPCIHYGQIHTYYGTAATKTKSYCSDALAKKLRKAKHGDLLIATTSEDVDACCKATVWLGDEDVVYSGDSYKYSHNQNPKYIAYLFKTEVFAKQKRMCATGAKVVRVSGDAMEKFRFKFPSPEKQTEIVSILDTFEESIENIKEEIELRQKQYEYYREKLLTFE